MTSLTTTAATDILRYFIRALVLHADTANYVLRNINSTLSNFVIRTFFDFGLKVQRGTKIFLDDEESILIKL